MNILKGRYNMRYEDCLNFPSKEAENDILLLEKEYDNFCNVYACVKSRPMFSQAQIAKVEEIRKKFDVTFKKIDLSDDFIDKLWDKHGCWKYFLSENAITKRYRNIIIETKYSDNYSELHELLREIDHLKKRGRIKNKKEIQDLIKRCSRLMEEKHLNECLACIFKTWDWKDKVYFD